MAKVSTGSIQQLEKSKPPSKCRKWRICVHVDGRRLSRRFSGRLTDARAELDRWRAELAQKPSGGATVAEYAERWLEVRRATGDFSASTLANDAQAVRYVSESPIGGMMMDDVTLDDCEAALLHIRDHPHGRVARLSGSTLRNVWATMRQLFGHAEVAGLIVRDPTRMLKSPRRDTAEKTALSPLEVELMLNRLDDEPLDGRIMALYLMLTLGLRRGESLALSYADLRDGVAHVCSAVDPVTGRIGAPKTEAGVRSLPMPQRLVHKLHEWADFRDSWGIADAPVIACTPQGRVMTASAIECWWTSNRDRLGCAGLTLHELRHSNLSMMARVMPSAFDLQRWAGWSSINPARTYVHRDMDALTAAAASVLPARAENAPV